MLLTNNNHHVRGRTRALSSDFQTFTCGGAVCLASYIIESRTAALTNRLDLFH